MIPLSMAEEGVESTILRVGGTPRIRKHLSDLGFSAGGSVTLISQFGGNLIVKVKDSRIAVSSEMAAKIMVS